MFGFYVYETACKRIFENLTSTFHKVHLDQTYFTDKISNRGVGKNEDLVVNSILWNS